MPEVADLLIEIGTEELPPRSLKALIQSLQENFRSQLTKANFSFTGVDQFATPRRLALRVRSLERQQPPQKIEKRGPAVSAAFDDQGQPSKAAIGFMRSCGISQIDELDRLKTDKGEWLAFRNEIPGERIDEKLQEMVQKSLEGLPIERPMRWGSGREAFVRPVHWMLCLYGGEILPITLFGIQAGNTTQGHRFMAPGAITINSPDDYEACLEAVNVIADFETRKGLIRKQVSALEAAQNARAVIDEALLDEVTALVEWPEALVGNFQPEFLEVPDEVLISAMKSHQKYFHMVDAAGELLPRFITVANLSSPRPEIVIKGNERVITPRLSDARFFFEQDKKQRLDQRLEKLGQVVFQNQLGSYRDKARRISELAAQLAQMLDADVETSKRAGLLCKTDLITDMVGEFADLQGIMGGYYAAHDGEDPRVVAAIRDHYRPTASGGILPDALESQCVAIADKLDTLTGLFGIGQPPTGSKDPFALRRQAIGIIRMCIETPLELDLRSAIDSSVQLHDKGFESETVYTYLVDRLAGWHVDSGFSSDTISAIIASSDSHAVFSRTHQKIKELSAFRTRAEAEQLIAGNKRVANILKKLDTSTWPEPDPTLFSESAEQHLFDALLNTEQAIATIQAFGEKLTRVATLQQPIDRYFDDVMVMADDERLKNNRLATLVRLRRLFLGVADFSLLQ